ncbi:hypothetical protein [Chryseolinea sp. H1M3-3]|uniref:hypothetical protein n=1 Tax=Chryseolinea sp. H1M3-3 TaxID=3034144 RepID=UPI0023ECD642|nr:hypothetical protein [Chryseolinea sp. H1M3-3]
MDIIKENLATMGLSGRLGDEFVCRQIKNRTHLEFLNPVSGLLSPYPFINFKIIYRN